MNAELPRTLSDELLVAALAHPADANGWRSMDCAPRMPMIDFAYRIYVRHHVLILFDNGETHECMWYSPGESDSPGWRRKPSESTLRMRALAWRPLDVHPGPEAATLLRSEAFDAETAALRCDTDADFHRRTAESFRTHLSSLFQTDQMRAAKAEEYDAKAVADDAEAAAHRVRRDELLAQAASS